MGSVLNLLKQIKRRNHLLIPELK